MTAPVRIVPLSGRPVRLRGLHSYFGEISLGSGPDGLVVTDTLSLERYLLGLNEVPLDWPMEALRAQAVAARTYSLWTLAHGRAGAAATYGFDICASQECQVFSGADVVRTRDGSRWARAVRTTAGQAIVFRREPILARYHSTSGGVTLDNSQAFVGSPDLPYLRSVSSPYEQASPLFRWKVEFRLATLEEILRSAAVWKRARGRLLEVVTVDSARGSHYPDVVLRGERSTLVMSAEDLRVILREHAPRLHPDRYPSFARAGSIRLPETLPSNRVDIATSGQTVEVAGRGWGHGVGMSQWGARGMALRGADYGDILRHYYSGTRIEELPASGPIEVGVAWGQPAVSVFGAFSIEDAAGGTRVPHAFGTWRFVWNGSGAVDIRAPRRFGGPLKVHLESAPGPVRAGRPVALRFRLSAPSMVAALASGPAEVASRAVVRNAGRHRLRWRAPERPGRYGLVVRASDGSTTARSQRRVLVVTPRLEPGVGGGRSWTTIALAVAGAALLALVAVGAASFASTIRK